MFKVNKSPMLSDIMICYSCKRVIPPDSFRLLRNGISSEAEDHIECPYCKIFNLVYLAKGRATHNPTDHSSELDLNKEWQTNKVN
jgi:DNA-directed RNA polymerase subunit RPC12/RpoP